MVEEEAATGAAAVVVMVVDIKKRDLKIKKTCAEGEKRFSRKV